MCTIFSPPSFYIPSIPFCDFGTFCTLSNFVPFCAFFFRIRSLQYFEPRQLITGRHSTIIRESRPHRPQLVLHTPTALHLVKWMLDPNPESRANIEDVSNHPWLLQTFPRLTDPTPSSQPTRSTPQPLLTPNPPSACPSTSLVPSTSPSPSPAPSPSPSPSPSPCTCTTFLSPIPPSSKRRKLTLSPNDN